MGVLASVVDVTAQKEKEELQKELLHRAEAEQRRIGQDLHDTLGQQLLSIYFLCIVHKKKLTSRSIPEASDAAQIEELLNQAKTNLRKLSRGLYSADFESQGLGGAIKDMAENVREMSSIPCRFEGDTALRLPERSVSEHLYKLAQEAVSNAVKHSFAKTITVSLARNDHQVVLTVRDDGVGLSPSADEAGGLGLRTMRYRANVIGASLEVRPHEQGGTIVTCSVNVSCPKN
jgi:signal transduction histidine kinase